MKTLITFVIAFISLSGIAQDYEAAMEKGMGLMAEDLNKAEAHFSRIADATPNKWLPAYYVAFNNINTTWGNKNGEQVNLKLEKAQKYLDQAKTVSPENPEIMVLQALLNTAYIAFDGQTYGMKLSGPTTAIYKKVLAIAPKNPRVISNYAQWNIGSAQWFGKPTEPYCNDLKKALKLFEAEQPENSFAPSWGKQQTEQALANCGK